jgi:hypothetical protein
MAESVNFGFVGLELMAGARGRYRLSRFWGLPQSLVFNHKGALIGELGFTA